MKSLTRLEIIFFPIRNDITVVVVDVVDVVVVEQHLTECVSSIVLSNF